MLRFTIFGIPVAIEPWFWLVTAMLGGGYGALSSNSPDAYLWVIVWMAICFISILVHELGHAISGIRLGGGRTWIKLWAMGGLAYNEGGRFTQKTRALMILAGPGAGLCLFAAVAGLMVLIWPNGIGLEILWKWMILSGDPRNMSHGALIALIEDFPKLRVINIFVWINLWWSLVNLLPIFPLDGGQFAECFIKSRKKLHQIGMVTGILVAVCGYVYLGSWYIGLLFGYLAYQNYKGYQQAQY